jgi:probable phosphoglycerate mutase
VVRDEHHKLVAEISKFIGHATNNIAEYTALVAAFEALIKKLGTDAREATVAVMMDSKLVIEQMNGKWKVKHPNMKPLHAQASALARSFKAVTFAHIPREENGEADALANEAMDRGSN